jgi:hypothetical protein
MWNVLNIGAEDGRRKGSGKMIDEKVLIERLEEEKSDWNCDYNVPINKAIQIVKDLASEHNNGWVSCSERLPEETEQHSTKYDPITLAEADVEWHTVSDLVNVIVKNYDTDEVFVCDDCTVDGEWANFGSYPFEVLAWQPMPEIPAPYKKGE